MTKGCVTVTGSDLDFRMLPLTLEEDEVRGVRQDLGGNIKTEEEPWRRDRLPTPVFLGFSGGSDSIESACNVGDPSSNPGLGRSPGGGYGSSLQYSCLQSPMDRGVWGGYSLWGHKESDITE